MKSLARLCLIIVAGLALAGCNRLDNHQPLSSHTFPFTSATSISQSFVAHANNLDRVDICLRNPGRTLIPLRFILTNNHGQLVHALDFTGGNIDNDDCTRFQFAPLPDSAGQSYSATIMTNFAKGEDLETKDLLRLGVYIEGHDGGDYWEGTASVDGLATDYDLHFKTFYQQNLNEVMRQSLHNLLIRLTKDPLFFFIFLLLLIGLFVRYKQIK